MIGGLILTYLFYLIVTSWIFWTLIGAVASLVLYVASPVFRTLVGLTLALGVLFLIKG